MPIISRCKYCGRKIEYGKNVCEKCMAKNLQQKKSYVKYYDKHIRDKKCTQFYNGKEWREKREDIKRRDDGLCLLCLMDEHKISYVDAVHHIIELKEDWSKRLDDDNLICLCDGCHKKVHVLYKDKHKKIHAQAKLMYIVKNKNKR